MFGMGTWEILLILVVALVFIGPDKLPQVAKSIGKGVRQVRNALGDVDAQVRRASHDLLDAAERAADLDEGEGEAPAAPNRAGPDGAGPVVVTPAGDDERGAAPPHGEPSEPPAEPQTNAEWLAYLRRPIEGRVPSPPPGRERPNQPNPAAVERGHDGAPPEAEPK